MNCGQLFGARRGQRFVQILLCGAWTQMIYSLVHLSVSKNDHDGELPGRLGMAHHEGVLRVYMEDCVLLCRNDNYL